MAKTITAKYPGQCAACGRSHISKGDLIIQHPAGGWALKSCPTRRKSPANQSKIYHQNITAPDAPPRRPRFNIDDAVMAERIRIKKLYANEDYSWCGKEDFY